jgi:hypothetical protein
VRGLISAQPAIAGRMQAGRTQGSSLLPILLVAIAILMI